MTIGIYQIQNKISGKVYIGQSQDVEYRLKDHLRLLKNNKHPNVHLQNSFNKHGESNFEFKILEKVPVEFLTQHEQYWLDVKKEYYSAGVYNIGTCADCPCRGIKRGSPTEEHRRKNSEGTKRAYAEGRKTCWNKGLTKEIDGRINYIASRSSKFWGNRCKSAEHRKNIGLALRGRYLTEEHKQNLSKATVGKKRKPFTREHKEKLSIAKIGKKLPPRSKEYIQKLKVGHKLWWARRRKDALRKLVRVLSNIVTNRTF